MVQTKITVTWMRPDDILVGGFNPRSRTSERNLAALVQSMKKNGFFSYEPLKIASNGMLADGHRRLAAAKIAGIDKVPVIETDFHIGHMYKLNETHRKHTPREWLQVYVKGMEDAVPDRITRKIMKLKEVVGNKGLIFLAEKDLSPNIYNLGVMVARYCETNSLKFQKKIIYWLANNQQQFAVRSAMREQVAHRLIIDAINEDRKLERIWRLSE
jgi:hypothetical protein